jgi:hypothetical protein
VYRITKIDDPTITYIGSTLLTLQRRWRVHKSQKSCSISKLLNKYGCENFNFVLIKEYLVCDKIHLRAYEQLWINKYKMKNCCINEIDALSFLKKVKQKHYVLDNKEQIRAMRKQYWLENKEQLKEKNKEYRQDHKEQIKEKQKEYRQDHKEQILEHKKHYYQQNKEQIKTQHKEKITCECGCIIARGDISKHKKTMKHIKLME